MFLIWILDTAKKYSIIKGRRVLPSDSLNKVLSGSLIDDDENRELRWRR